MSASEHTASLLEKSSAAQRLDRSLKGRLQFPLPDFLVRVRRNGNGNDATRRHARAAQHHKIVRHLRHLFEERLELIRAAAVRQPRHDDVKTITRPQKQQLFR